MGICLVWSPPLLLTQPSFLRAMGYVGRGKSKKFLFLFGWPFFFFIIIIFLIFHNFFPVTSSPPLGGWNFMIFEVPFNPTHSMIICNTIPRPPVFCRNRWVPTAWRTAQHGSVGARHDLNRNYIFLLFIFFIIFFFIRRKRLILFHKPDLIKTQSNNGAVFWLLYPPASTLI